MPEKHIVKEAIHSTREIHVLVKVVIDIVEHVIESKWPMLVRKMQLHLEAQYEI